MKLFVDDLRTPPKSGFQCAKDFDGAVLLLKLLKFDFVTLDYDLGNGFTGLDILKFMHENKRYPENLNIHSDHSEGRFMMLRYAEENFPDSVSITMNPFRE